MFKTAAALSRAIPVQDMQVESAPVSGRLAVVINHSHNSPLKAAEHEEGAIEARQTADSSSDQKTLDVAIREQLARLLESSQFINSHRLSRFLRFIVEHVISGDKTHLKEYVIGSEVYDRRPPYNPSQDSIVRTEARRLRGKLKEYYETEGKHDPICVYLRPGSYIPAFQYKQARTGLYPSNFRTQSSPKSPAAVVAILPFRDISGTPLSSAYARGIPDELAFSLMQTKQWKVISPGSIARSCEQENDVPAAMVRAGAQVAYEGSVREEGNHLRVTGTIVDCNGIQLWTRRVDTQSASQTLFTIEEQIASALSAGLEIIFGRIALRSNP